ETYQAIKNFLKTRKGSLWQRILRFTKQKIKGI
ncbi:MAG TPA: sugar transferase, partial [Daejeonella sp.]|nr:sugar transferase [Daejeonella sp.]